MTIHVKVVPAAPYGRDARFALQIESGHRAGETIEHGVGGDAAQIRWASRTAAAKWARDTGYTVDPTEDDKSTALLIDLFETFNDFQFQDRSISGADLVERLGVWLRIYRAEVFACPNDIGAQKLKGLYEMTRPLEKGDAPVNGAQLVDLVSGWLLDTQQNVMPMIVGETFTAKVAKAADVDWYWSEQEGWGELEDATAFFRNVPPGLRAAQPVTWVETELAMAQRAVEREPATVTMGSGG